MNRLANLVRHVTSGRASSGESGSSGAAATAPASSGAAARVQPTAKALTPIAVNGDGDGSAAIPIDLEGAKFGAINAMRTGNPAYDMAIAMVVPMVFKLVFDSAQSTSFLAKQLMQYLKKPQAIYERHIALVQVRTYWGYTSDDENSRNAILVKALTLYLAQKDIKYTNASVDLVGLQEYCYGGSDSDEDEDVDSRSEAGQLKKHYRLTRAAPEGQWTTVEPDLRYMKKVEEEGGDKEGGRGGKRTITISLSADTEERVDKFVNKAYEWYLGELEKMQDHSRYMYEMIAAGSPKEGEDASRKYRRYKLSDEKTFDSLFFPEKDILLKLIEDFQSRSGKYSIPGYPHKLGLLCHGPPGTGKTSLIKAMAHHTKRNIVNVPLARIHTNAELMEVMFDSKYLIVGQETPIKLRFKDVIFVMEDVDAISKIVHRRDGKDVSGPSLPDELLELGPALAAEKGPLVSVPEGAASGQGPPEATQAAAASGADAVAAGEQKSLMAAAQLVGTSPFPFKEASSGLISSSNDRLNLSGILNALDGVVDSPKRILIMTTNHPEKLDEALIRPGRIDKKFLLNYMAGPQCSMMVAHYFQTTLPDEQKDRICELVDEDPALEITPARLEQLCAEHDEVDGLLDALSELKKPAPKVALSRAGSVSVEGVLARAQSVPVGAAKVSRW